MTLFQMGQERFTSDDYYTPAWVFELLDVRFDVDVAAPPGGVPWIPANRVLTMAEDGLTSPWDGRVWMNPPFSSATSWVKRFVDHGDGIALLSLGLNSAWVDDLWGRVDGIVLLPPDMQFVRPGMDEGRPMHRSSLFAFGGWAVDALSRIGRVR